MVQNQLAEKVDAAMLWPGAGADGIADGGTVRVSTPRTGGIPAGTPDLISDGVFVISGAIVQQVVNDGPVTTRGQNDMVLNNWGEVTGAGAVLVVTSRGPSGIGFVNLGQIDQLIDQLEVRAPIQTFGVGARSFNSSPSTTDRYSCIVPTARGRSDEPARALLARPVRPVRPGGACVARDSA